MDFRITRWDTGAPIYTSTTASNLREAVIEAVANRANLRFANLRFANLRFANLRSADLRFANLRFADLGSADLRFADLGSADLGSADLRFADLRFVDLRFAYLAGTAKAPEKVLSALRGRAHRSDGYEFLIFSMEGGTIIRAGCRTFTPKEFKAHVAEQYPGGAKAKETLRIIAFLEAQAKADAE